MPLPLLQTATQSDCSPGIASRSSSQELFAVLAPPVPAATAVPAALLAATQSPWAFAPLAPAGASAEEREEGGQHDREGSAAADGCGDAASCAEVLLGLSRGRTPPPSPPHASLGRPASPAAALVPAPSLGSVFLPAAAPAPPLPSGPQLHGAVTLTAALARPELQQECIRPQHPILTHVMDMCGGTGALLASLAAAGSCSQGISQCLLLQLLRQQAWLAEQGSGWLLSATAAGLAGM